MKKSKDLSVTHTPDDEWGGEVIHERLPSGAKLKLDEDSDCILRFMGLKDISDKMGKEAGEVQYLIMHDGKRVVSLPMSYAFTEVPEWKKDHWYYIHNQASIVVNPDFNPMKDITVRDLGPSLDEAGILRRVTCPKRVHPDGVIILAWAEIAEANYNRLNYPLRTSVIGRKPAVDLTAKRVLA